MSLVGNKNLHVFEEVEWAIAEIATALPFCFFRVMLFDDVSRMCCPS